MWNLKNAHKGEYIQTGNRLTDIENKLVCLPKGRRTGGRINLECGEGNGNSLQSSCLENAMDRGAWQATVHGVTKSRSY